MATQSQHYEGQADGTNVSIANSTTFGDSPASLVEASNGTTAYTTETAAHGSRSVKLAMTAGATACKMDIGLGGVNTTSIAARAYLKLGSRPTSAVRVLGLRSTIAADLGGINFYEDGTVSATDITGALLSRSSASTQVIDPAVWYRFEAAWTISASAGSYKAAVYIGDSTSPWFSYTSPTTMNTGTANIGEIRAGKCSNTATIGNPWYLDDFTVVDGTASFVGPYVASGPAIATAITPGFVKLDATGSTPAVGGALTYSVSPSTGVLQSPPGVFYIPQTTTAKVVTLTVTEAGGGSTAQSVTIPSSTSASSSQTTVMTQRYIGGAWQ